MHQGHGAHRRFHAHHDTHTPSLPLSTPSLPPLSPTPNSLSELDTHLPRLLGGTCKLYTTK